MLSFHPGNFVHETRSKITRKYRFIRKIGYGTYSSVVSAVHIKTGVKRAIKAISKKNLASRANAQKFIDEIEIMK
jgi:serine/threonine protein kinase